MCCDYPISGYDACYVALAHQIKAPLITADEKLVRAMAGKYNVKFLATYPLPSL
jgi:predicted nucleic acid-binding protein